MHVLQDGFVTFIVEHGLSSLRYKVNAETYNLNVLSNTSHAPVLPTVFIKIFRKLLKYNNELVLVPF